MGCDPETSRQLTLLLVQQFGPFYAAAFCALAGLGVIAFGLWKGLVTAPPWIRAIVTACLAAALVLTVYRIGYDRAVMHELTAHGCVRGIASQR